MYVIMCTNMSFTVTGVYLVSQDETLGTSCLKHLNLFHERRGFPGKHTAVYEVKHFCKEGSWK